MPELISRLESTRLENRLEGARKFWECTLSERRAIPTDPRQYTVVDYVVTVTFGKIGTNGQVRRVGGSASQYAAEEEYRDLIRRKLQRGYSRTDGPSLVASKDDPRPLQDLADAVASLSTLADYDTVPLPMTRTLLRDILNVVPERAMKAWEIRSIRSRRDNATTVAILTSLPEEPYDDTPEPPPRPPEPTVQVVQFGRRRLIMTTNDGGE